jgi:peptide/nickel transport system substrate-binding protein
MKLSITENIARAKRSFSLTEKVMLYIFTATFSVTGLFLLWQMNESFMVEVPAKGGIHKEGIIGFPRFINPVLATSGAEKDMVSLIYSGLLKRSPSGELEKELAGGYDISSDGLVYSFWLRDDIYFHDGKPVTAWDVLFTIEKIIDPAIQSPKRSDWEGVRVEVVNNREINFILTEPYAPFLENATLKILPAHIWEQDDAEGFVFSRYNIEPVGSGPYRIQHVKRNPSGIPEQYTLKAFNGYALGEPMISRMDITFYPNEDALIAGYVKNEVDNISSIKPENVDKLREERIIRIRTASLPRVFAVFFNQNRSPVLTHKEVRLALNEAINKDRLVSEVLYSYGVTLEGPLPRSFLALQERPERIPETSDEKILKAQEILRTAGWKPNEETSILEKKSGNDTYKLSFSLATSSAPELVSTANYLKLTWERIGAEVEIKMYEPTSLAQEVIRTRQFDALLFGKIVGRDLDLYAFWHSSQRNDPGLNISTYANLTTDKLLEEMRTIKDFNQKLEKYAEFEKEIKKDMPAIFLYSPQFLYVIRNNIDGFKMENINQPSERFLNVHEWSIHKEKVWRIFAR